MGEDIRSLSQSISILRDEVFRLNYVVSKLEARAAGRAVQARDVALTLAGGLLSVSSVVWLLRTFGVM